MNNKNICNDNENIPEEAIRPPDEIVREQLVQNTKCDFQKQIHEAMYQSLQEIKQQQNLNLEYEEKLLNEYVK
jgi:hypothetical protein